MNSQLHGKNTPEGIKYRIMLDDKNEKVRLFKKTGSNELVPLAIWTYDRLINEMNPMTTNVCPACGGYWYENIEEDTGNPYTCYTCRNGTITNFETEEEDYGTRTKAEAPCEKSRTEETEDLGQPDIEW